MRTKLFLDMDGVLVDFVNPALQALGRTEKDTDIAHWDMAQQLSISNNEFWKAQDQLPNFWLDLKPYEGAKDFYRQLTAMTDVYICTSPSLHDNCASHKLRWLDEHLGRDARMSAIVTAHKSLNACLGRILIDDSVKHIETWEKEGGWTFLFPRPWNTKRHQAQTVAEAYVLALDYVKGMTQ